jgi:hypothetical protein
VQENVFSFQLMPNITYPLLSCTVSASPHPPTYTYSGFVPPPTFDLRTFVIPLSRVSFAIWRRLKFSPVSSDFPALTYFFSLWRLASSSLSPLPAGPVRARILLPGTRTAIVFLRVWSRCTRCLEVFAKARHGSHIPCASGC